MRFLVSEVPLWLCGTAVCVYALCFMLDGVWFMVYGFGNMGYGVWDMGHGAWGSGYNL